MPPPVKRWAAASLSQSASAGWLLNGTNINNPCEQTADDDVENTVTEELREEE
jgi:exopolysaccharide biosynthesis protein